MSLFFYNGLVRFNQSDSKDEPFNYMVQLMVKNGHLIALIVAYLKIVK